MYIYISQESVFGHATISSKVALQRQAECLSFLGNFQNCFQFWFSTFVRVQTKRNNSDIEKIINAVKVWNFKRDKKCITRIHFKNSLLCFFFLQRQKNENEIHCPCINISICVPVVDKVFLFFFFFTFFLLFSACVYSLYCYESDQATLSEILSVGNWSFMLKF